MYVRTHVSTNGSFYYGCDWEEDCNVVYVRTTSMLVKILYGTCTISYHTVPCGTLPYSQIFFFFCLVEIAFRTVPVPVELVSIYPHSAERQMMSMQAKRLEDDTVRYRYRTVRYGNVKMNVHSTIPY